MGALSNKRQERFCQLVKQGIPPIRAYPMAGYNAHDSAPYRLCGNVRVKRRLHELTKGLAMKTRVTIETITAQLDADRELARAVDQPGAAIQATVAKAKLHGLLIDRKETGAPGDFAGLKSPEEVIAALREQLGDAVADAVMAATLGEPEQPAPVEQPTPTASGSGTLN